MDLKEEDILGDDVAKHWYYRSKSSALLRYVQHLNPQHIMDVGAGSGFFSKALLRQTSARQALCIDTSYTSEGEEWIAGKPVRYSTHCGVTDADLILMMDVLEHVDDDIALLREYINKVPTNAHFIITVPAFTMMWSEHDVYLDHKRRYTLSKVECVASEAGLVIERGSYYYGLVFPLAAVTRLANRVSRNPNTPPRSQLKKHGIITNEILAGICMLDLFLLKLNRMAGLTVFCLARKP